MKRRKVVTPLTNLEIIYSSDMAPNRMKLLGYSSNIFLGWCVAAARTPIVFITCKVSHFHLVACVFSHHCQSISPLGLPRKVPTQCLNDKANQSAHPGSPSIRRLVSLDTWFLFRHPALPLCFTTLLYFVSPFYLITLNHFNFKCA